MKLTEMAARLDKLARVLHKGGQAEASHELCVLRDQCLASESRASRLDRLAKEAQDLGLSKISSQLCVIRDSLNGPEKG